MEVKETPKQWYEIPQLKGTRLGSLAVDLSEAIKARQDAEKREEAIRSLMLPMVTGMPEPCQAGDLELTWVLPSLPTEYLDKTALLLAGVTPEQIALGTKTRPPKKPHLRVSVISSEGAGISETPRNG